ncbi:MAG: glycosyltransferase family 2 protein [Pseudomonadota bacterium]
MRLLFQIWRRRKELTLTADRTGQITADSILAFSTVRNEIVRLPHFLAHYRKLGVNHFLFVDNDSDDGTTAFLAEQPDVSLWTTPHGYRASRFGMDWLGWLHLRYGRKHWCLSVDADEILVYPDSENRDLRALTTWLDDQGLPSFGALMLDMYPKGAVQSASYTPGDDPFKTLNWFDGDNYRTNQLHPYFHNVWIQGGVRDRLFFGDEPERSPTLNKTPLVKWHWRYVYVNSTHQMLPIRLHDVFDFEGDSKVSGVFLHTKFLPIIVAKSAEELERGQHFQNHTLYYDYHRSLTEDPELWYEGSYRYEGPEQLIKLGLMCKGSWL